MKLLDSFYNKNEDDFEEFINEKNENPVKKKFKNAFSKSEWKRKKRKIKMSKKSRRGNR